MDAPPSLETLYDAHAAGLYHYLTSIVREEADARDLLQELFIRLAARPLGAEVRDARAFLFRMAHNLAVDWLRRREVRLGAEQVVKEAVLHSFEEPADPDALAFARCVEAALAELPVEQRTVVWLKLWEGLTFEEIALTQGIPLNTAASRHRYAIDKLRTLLRPLYEEIQPP